MSEVLVTCPPMLRQIASFDNAFAKSGFNVTAPDVVQVMSEQELLELLPRFDGWIIGDDPATRAVFAAGAAGKLRAAVKWGVGVDNVDFDAAREFAISIDNTPGMFGAEVADLAMHYLSGLARQAYFIDRKVREGVWQKPSGRSLSSLTVGLIGYGDIGRHFAHRASAAGVSLIVYDPFLDDVSRVAPHQTAAWPERADACDMFVLTCALTDSNRHMINEETLRWMRPGVQIVNVARGGLIDEAALIGALDAGHVSAVALDVFEVEPLPCESPLRNHANTIFGSHNGSNTVEAVERASLEAIEKLTRFLEKAS